MKRFLFYFYATWFLLALTANGLLWNDTNNKLLAQEQKCGILTAQIEKAVAKMPKDTSAEMRAIQKQLYNIIPADEPETI
jgi:hypothetical protein